MFPSFLPRRAGSGAAPPAGALRGLLVAQRVALDVPVTTRSAALAHAARLLDGVAGLTFQDVLDALVAREALGTTALGSGCGIPHARMDALETPVAAFVRTAAPVPFDAPDGRGVRELFVLLVPHDADETHLEMLAAAVERFADSKFRQAVRECTAPCEIVALFDR